jgi:anti-sigma regulatory factor (Ser/Thr protein kinase)
MKPWGPNDCTMRIVLPATGLALEEFFIEFRRLIQSALPQKHRFAAELLVREALNNAVLHGCRADPANHIRCVFRLKGRCLTMVVEDWGEGFDWRAVRDRRADPEAFCGRGMELLQTLATRVRFNEKGNKVAIFKQCQ